MADDIAARLASETKLEDALYRTIAFCERERTYDEVAHEIESYPEMKKSAFPIDTVLSWLVDVAAIETLDASVDEEEPFQAKAEDGAEEETQEHFVITEVGLEALARYRSADRLAELRCFEGRYESVFVELLEFCRTPQSKQSIEARLKGNPLTETPRVFPGFFIDRLERSGALAWDTGWKTTDAGAAWLAARDKAR